MTWEGLGWGLAVSALAWSFTLAYIRYRRTRREFWLWVALVSLAAQARAMRARDRTRR